MEFFKKVSERFAVSNLGRVHNVKNGRKYFPKAKLGTFRKLWVDG